MVFATLKSRARAIRTDLAWLAMAISLSILPHIPRLPIWIPVVFLSMVFWKLLTANPDRRPGFIGQLGRLIFAFSMFAAILVNYGSLVGRDAGISLLIVLTGLKFMETRNLRDFYITSYISMFLVLTNFLYTQTILTTLYMLFVVTIFISTLSARNDEGNCLGIGDRLFSSGAMLLQAIPLMLILFVLFPRIPGPLWGLPRDAYAGLTGIDDEMQPGSISDLILSDEIAFRVQFSSAVPENRHLYWRGPVLWQTDGVKWFPDRPQPYTAELKVAGEPVTYTVTLEPTHQHWLFGLEMPVTPAEESTFSNDMQLTTRQPVRQRMRYEISSHTDYLLQTSNQEELLRALQLPRGYHPRAVALGTSWREQGMSATQIIDTAIRMFNEQEYFYTTSPPLMLEDIVDQFLFDERRGFCEHYAAAFTILMRAAGIPARVVTGYQGGTVNPIDGFMVVRQHDAHAWTEVWLQERGWTRVDPTAAVSPERILSGITGSVQEALINIPLGLQNNETARNFWQQFRDTFDAVNNSWNQWVLSYDDRQQLLLFNRIGIGKLDWSTLGIIIVAVVLLFFSAVYLWLFRRQSVSRDKARLYYDRFCAQLAKTGVKRYASEGPLDFAARAKLRRRELAESISRITELYINVRYGDRDELLNQLKEQVRDFKVGRQMI